MRVLVRHLDKVLLVLCTIAFLVAAAFAALRFRHLDAIAMRNPAPATTAAAYEPRASRVPEIDTVLWPAASPQSRGTEWLYDVFTPPVIYYNRDTGQFTVTPPSSDAPVVRDDGDFALDLVSVRQEPYRIQLVGYVGDEAAPLATFENVENGDTLVGRAGRVFEREQFTLVSFDIRRVTTSSADSMPVIETIGIAVLRDGRTDREETLTTRERKMMPRLQAVFRLRSESGEQRVVREGTSITIGGLEYFVAQLSLAPMQAVVSRRPIDGSGSPETRTLVPASSAVSNPFGRDSRPADIFSFPTR
jgi:hypothetical protein